MNKYHTLLIGYLTMVSIGTIAAEDFVMVKAPCYEKDANGQCMKWGVISRGCRAPIGGKCTVDFTLLGKRAICNAENGATCTQIMKFN